MTTSIGSLFSLVDPFSSGAHASFPPTRPTTGKPQTPLTPLHTREAGSRGTAQSDAADPAGGTDKLTRPNSATESVPIDTPGQTGVASANPAASIVAEKKPAPEPKIVPHLAGQPRLQQIRALQAEGQSLSQIAVDLSIPLAAVDEDLKTDIPRYNNPASAPAKDGQASLSIFA